MRNECKYREWSIAANNLSMGILFYIVASRRSSCLSTPPPDRYRRCGPNDRAVDARDMVQHIRSRKRDQGHDVAIGWRVDAGLCLTKRPFVLWVLSQE